MNQKVECSVCSEEMVINGGDISHDFTNKKEYKRTIYWCKKDDVWVTIEKPLNKADKV